jgi:hypothetical protein
MGIDRDITGNDPDQITVFIRKITVFLVTESLYGCSVYDMLTPGQGVIDNVVCNDRLACPGRCGNKNGRITPDSIYRLFLE